MPNAREQLLGEWTLVSWTGIDGDGRPVRHGGESPSGELIYLASGRVAVQIQHEGRNSFGSRDWSSGDTSERTAAYSTYNAYCGTFSLPEPGIVVHHVELAIHPDQPGMDKRRRYLLEGDDLALHTQKVETPTGPASSELRWRRRDRDGPDTDRPAAARIDLESDLSTRADLGRLASQIRP